jgi:hypothetical protein
MPNQPDTTMHTVSFTTVDGTSGTVSIPTGTPAEVSLALKTHLGHEYGWKTDYIVLTSLNTQRTSYFMLVDTVSSRFIRENHATDASMIQYELRQYIIRHAIQVLDLNEIYSYYKITTVGAYAFNACTSLVTVVIPPGVTAVMTHAFSQCVAVTTITVPDSVTTIGDYAFSKCTSLTTLAIPDQVTTIEICAFQKCVSLTTLTISDSVTTIGAYAYENCTSLTDINIPCSGTTIGNCAFDGCPLLQQPPTTSE